MVEDDENGLSSLLEGIAGFAIIEKATMRRAPNLRSSVDASLPRPLLSLVLMLCRLMNSGILWFIPQSL
jgi:hypothetical protein